MKNCLLEDIRLEEKGFALDGSGFSSRQASWCDQTRTEYLYQHWIKGMYTVDIASPLILVIELGDSQKRAPLSDLRQDIHRYGHYCSKRRPLVTITYTSCDGQTIRADDQVSFMWHVDHLHYR